MSFAYDACYRFRVRAYECIVACAIFCTTGLYGCKEIICWNVLLIGKYYKMVLLSYFRGITDSMSSFLFMRILNIYALFIE